MSGEPPSGSTRDEGSRRCAKVDAGPRHPTQLPPASRRRWPNFRSAPGSGQLANAGNFGDYRNFGMNLLVAVEPSLLNRQNT
jgi:hypothetical protein